MSYLLGATVSTGAIAESALLALAFAFIGYRISVRHRVVRGVTPWRLPSVAWALICLVFQFVGLAVELLAELTTRPSLPAPPRAVRTELGPYGPLARPAGPPGGSAGLEELVPEHLRPYSDPRLAPPAGARPGQPPDFGWYPDPFGRHGQRYFDGKRWGAEVVDGGVLSRDPV